MFNGESRNNADCTNAINGITNSNYWKLNHSKTAAYGGLIKKPIVRADKVNCAVTALLSSDQANRPIAPPLLRPQRERMTSVGPSKLQKMKQIAKSINRMFVDSNISQCNSKPRTDEDSIESLNSGAHSLSKSTETGSGNKP